MNARKLLRDLARGGVARGLRARLVLQVELDVGYDKLGQAIGVFEKLSNYHREKFCASVSPAATRSL